MKFKDNFEYELMPNLNTVIMHTKKCEGKHIQQVVYSTYHSGLTQICFGCKKIRTTIEIEEEVTDEETSEDIAKNIINNALTMARNKKGCGKSLWDEEGHCGEKGTLCLECSKKDSEQDKSAPSVPEEQQNEVPELTGEEERNIAKTPVEKEIKENLQKGFPLSENKEGEKNVA